MRRIYVWIFFGLVLVEVCSCQPKNPTEWPYGGVKILSPGRNYWLVFDSTANFRRATFRDTAKFFLATFQRPASFSKATFDSDANFALATFDSNANFSSATFLRIANMYEAKFHGNADFTADTFRCKAVFGFAKFDSNATFQQAKFDGDASFSYAKFDSDANFSNAKFGGGAIFASSTFHRNANFAWATFGGDAVFHQVAFDSNGYFSGATLLDTAWFIDAQSTEYLDFKNAQIKSCLWLGSHRPFRIDLSLALLSPQSKILLIGMVQLKMPIHKFEKLGLLETLSYTCKQQIIENLKGKSYEGNKEAAFELDYILAKSTMYQEQSDIYEPSIWHSIGNRLKWFFAWFYNATMGLGYRPFRIVWWALGIMVAGTIFCFVRMRKKINEYVVETFPRRKQVVSSNPKRKHGFSFNTFETLVNCAYFSVMLFFTFRMKGDMLTFFDAKEKKFIIIEWLFGLAVYVAFLYHTSAVLQNIKSLFIGG